MTISVSNQAKTLYVETNGVNYAYRKFGRQSEFPLVLFHRFRGTMDHWDPEFLDKLAESRAVIIFDSIGIGRTNGETPSTVAAMGQAAMNFIEALDYPKIDVLGWSLGGFIAQQLALDKPEMINKLVVAGSGPGGVAEAPSIPENVLEVMQKPNSGTPMEDFLFLFFTESETSRTAGIEHLGRLGKREEAFSPEASAQAVAAQGTAVMAWAMGQSSAYARLENLSQAVLVANGQHDIMIHAYNSYAIAQRAPNAKLVLYPDSGHGFLFQHAEQFVADVNHFLR